MGNKSFVSDLPGNLKSYFEGECGTGKFEDPCVPDLLALNRAMCEELKLYTPSSASEYDLICLLIDVVEGECIYVNPEALASVGNVKFNNFEKIEYQHKLKKRLIKLYPGSDGVGGMLRRLSSSLVKYDSIEKMQVILSILRTYLFVRNKLNLVSTSQQPPA